MQCFALGFLKNNSSRIKWAIAQEYDGYFVNKGIYAQQKELVKLCAGLEMNQYKTFLMKNVYLYAIKTHEGSCMFTCDEKLSSAQRHNLCLWLFGEMESRDKIVKNFDKYINTPPQIVKINNELDETKQILTQNIHKLFERGQAIDTLHEESIEVEIQAKKLNKKAQELNDECSCTLF